jgi:hypothetical protein
VVNPAIRLGVACVYLASAILAPIHGQGTEEGFLNEVVEFFGEIDNNVAAVAMGTPEFEQAFFEGRRPLLTLEQPERTSREPTLMRFALAEKEWAVFRIDQELVRGLWANEIRDILFYERRPTEGTSTNMNGLFLNTMVLQSCDSPIGYPAFTSPFMESLVNPWTL